MNQNTNPLATSKPSGKNFLFAIAIDKYQHLAPTNHRVPDVQNIIQLLSRQFHFSKNETITLYDDAATTQNIYQKLEELVGAISEKDNLIIYFSGQGEYKEVFNQGYWIPVDAAAGNVANYIPNSEFFTILNSFRAKHILLLTDSCFSVSFFDEDDLPAANVASDLGSRWIISEQRKSIVTENQKGTNHFNQSIIQYLENITSSFSVMDLQEKILADIPADENVEPMGGALTIAGHDGGVWTFKIKPNEEKDWTTVDRENTMVGFQSYLAKFPEGKYRTEATQRLEVLKVAAEKIRIENAAWQNAKTENSVASFLEYKKKFPRGKYSAEADSKIAMISISGGSGTVSSAPPPPTSSPTKKEEPKAVSPKKDTPPVPKKYSGQNLFVETTKKTKPPKEKKKKKERKPIIIPWEKYGKWAAMLLIPILIGWGGYKMYPFGMGAAEDKDVVENATPIELDKENNNDSSSTTDTTVNEGDSNALNFAEEEQEEELWDAVFIENTVNGFQKYLKAFPDGKHKEEALQKIKRFNENLDEQAWQNALQENTTLAYEAYKRNSPSGKYFEQANNNIERLNPGESIPKVEDEFKVAKDFIASGDRNFERENFKRAKMQYTNAAQYEYRKDYVAQKIQACDEKLTEPVLKPEPSKSIPAAIQKIEQNMFAIKGGTFEMGSLEGDSDEQPTRMVSVRGFRMGKFEITQEEYQAVMNRNPSANQGCKFCPVENVTYGDVQKFLKRLNEITGKNYRLPTEAEWEYAAKANESYIYGARSNSMNDAGWHRGNSSGKTKGRGRKGRNGFGLYDMSGNVAEWCSDWYDETYYSLGNNDNPRNATPGPSGARVIRGGAFQDDPRNCRITNRTAMSPRYAKPTIGFRIVIY